MANNPYVNKVNYGNQTIIDITDTTAVASDVAQGKYFYTADGAKVEGTASGGGLVMRTGTFTPTSFKTSVSFSVGTTDTIKNLLVVPTSESPLKSTGKTLYTFIANADLFLKSMIVASNNAGATLLAPSTSTSSKRFTQNADTITINSNAGSFELISYTWFAW